MSENVKKHNRQKIFIFFVVLIILTILVFFVKNILIDMIKLQVDNDYDGMEAFIRKQGVFGPLAVIIVEALQMVVVFISAEFIQIAAGLSFPWYLALLSCIPPRQIPVPSKTKAAVLLNYESVHINEHHYILHQCKMA